MQNKEQILQLHSSFRQRMRDNANFRQDAYNKFNQQSAEKSFGRICIQSFTEALAHCFNGENYNAGKRYFEEDDIAISMQDAQFILLTEPAESPLRQYVASMIEFDQHPLTRVFAYLGLNTEKRDINSKQSWKNLRKNLVGFNDNGSFLRNLLVSIPYLIWNLTVVSIKALISTVKLATEYVPYTLKAFAEGLAEKALTNTSPSQPWYIRWPLLTAFVVCQTIGLLFHIAYFIGRTITSPAKAVVAAGLGIHSAVGPKVG